MYTKNVPDELLSSFGFLLGKLSQKFMEEYEERLEELGLRSKHAGILILLNSNQGISQKEIGSRLTIDRTTIVKLLDKLEVDGLVERKVDLSDRRYYNIFLTEKGREYYIKSISILKESEEKIVKCLNIERVNDFKNTILDLL